MSDSNRREYAARLECALDYIRCHLTETITPGELAEAARFSPFHFQRLFSAHIGESPANWIHRCRLEKGADLILRFPQLSITSVALECGYESSAQFSRDFRRFFGVSPRMYRTGSFYPGEQHGREYDGAETSETAAFSWKKEEEIRQLPSLRLACVKHRSGEPHSLQEAWQTLSQWISDRNLFRPDTLMVGISWDNPAPVRFDHASYYACMTVPPGHPGDARVSILELTAGPYLVHHFYGTEEDIEKAYDGIFLDTLPRSGFQPDDKPILEIYRPAPVDTTEMSFEMEICVPIIPL